jgi:elongator complex protein 1
MKEANIVGSFNSGIRAACWAPDDSFLILVNGNEELLQMTRDFDVLYEAPLSTTEFGEGKTNCSHRREGMDA